MSTIKDYFELSQLAQAAYALFDAGAPETVLQGTKGKFSRTQAFVFLGLDENGAKIAGKGYTVLAHTPDDPATGFSATVFQSNETGKITIAIRGTDGTRGATIKKCVNEKGGVSFEIVHQPVRSS